MPSGIKKAMKVAFAGLKKLRSSVSYSDPLPGSDSLEDKKVIPKYVRPLILFNA